MTDQESISIVEKRFRTTSVVCNGRIVCQICFQGCETRNKKRHNFETIKDLEKFKRVSQEWTTKLHPYNTVVHHAVLWSCLQEAWAHERWK